MTSETNKALTKWTRRMGLLAVAMWFHETEMPACAADLITSTAHFEKFIRPVLNEFCITCHSTEKQKGELDLERFTSLSEVRKQPAVWQNVIDQITLGEMPPKEKPQPSSAQREQLLAWVRGVLNEVALANAGDPGPVVLRRLSNAEYTYTIRDLTGVAALDPAEEFPVDGASGEGFMNVGNSLVISPSLVTKYLDAGKEIASHAMLLPDGIRFSPKNTRRDWTEELLAEIRGVYGEFTDKGGGTSVNLQGIRFDTKDGGVLPLDKYLAAALELREHIGPTNIAVPLIPALSPQERGNRPSVSHAASHPVSTVASKHGLSPKYLATLWNTLHATNKSPLLDPIRARWRTAKPSDAAALANEISQWQHALWKFNSVGHIGKKNGPKSWMEPLAPIQSKQELRFKIPANSEAKEVTLYLVASDAGDGNENDFVVWEEPRFLRPGQPPLLLRDVREVHGSLSARRDRTLASTEKLLSVAARVEAGETNLFALAEESAVELDALTAWLDYLGLNASGPVKLEGHFTTTYSNANGYAFISGWGPSGTPNLAANSSGQHVRIPGNMKPHSVAIHPSPKLATAIGWRSPVSARVRVAAVIQHAHPECGNGVTWSLELRRGLRRQRLANGVAHGAKPVSPAPVENLIVKPGDVLSLLVGPRDGNHSCDLTAVDLTVTSAGDNAREWDLAKDVSPNVTAGNPHADRFGNEGVWHFYTEPDKGSPVGPVIPADSLLSKWQSSNRADERAALAKEIQKLLTSAPPENKGSPDAALHRQLRSLGGPLFHSLGSRREETQTKSNQSLLTSAPTNEFGIDPARFTNGNLRVRAPFAIEVRVPADLVAGCEFITTGLLDKTSGAEGSVQLQLLTNKPAANSGLLTIESKTSDGEGPWYSNNRVTSHTSPIIANSGSAARRRVEAAFEEFRQIFPAALCYTKIVPVDEVVTLTLLYREDDHFKRLMLDDTAAARLDQLWDQLHYVSQDALTLVDVFEQLWQYATQDADPSVFEPMRGPIKQRAAAFRELLTNSQPRHVEAVLEFADRAYRRPLTSAEKEALRALYHKLRGEELPHEDAIRLTIARVLVAPAFLYKAEKPGPGKDASPVSDWELASRLSYFLWSSAPDAELRSLAAAGTLRDAKVLTAQARRMIRDARVRRLATEFGCAWLHIYDFDELSEKSDRHFPTFTALRGDMYEETIRFFTDLFQNDRSVRNILDADYTFVNEPLAKHYALTQVKFHGSNDWQRVEGLKQFSRGGILAQATTLAKQSGASRTSPILRGNWVSEVLLGEKLPRPPKDVPQLPEDEATETLTVRQLTEKHSSDPRCAGCHSRIDGFGFALEKFDAIGRARERDLGNRAIDTRGKVLDGSEFDGLDELRGYLLNQRGDAFLKQFCRKLLGYSLGRAVLLSDQPLIDEMLKQLKANEYRVSTAVETIVLSKQFREIRGMEMANEE